MDIPNIEMSFEFGKNNEVEFFTHKKLDGGCTMYVHIDGNCAYEINLEKTGLNLTVKEYDGKVFFDKSLEDLWWNEDEDEN